MSERARRATTEAERTLFYEALSDVKPLKPVAKPARAKRPSAAKTAKPALPISMAKPPAPRPMPKPAPDQPPEIGGHRAIHVRKGRIEPDARLDLHGMTQATAHTALLQFLTRARTSGARIALVIPGKSGVLNKQFKRWLVQGEFGHLVSGISAAHKRHGGAGAFYVLLKRPRT